MSKNITQNETNTLNIKLGPLAVHFTRQDNALNVIDKPDMQIITGFGPTNAPTAGTLSVMMGIIKLQAQLKAHTTVVISDLGAWNCRNTTWSHLTETRDQMCSFLINLGFNLNNGEIRSHLDHKNLVRAGRIARFLNQEDITINSEYLLEHYQKAGLTGSNIGQLMDALYTTADILGPAETGCENILMVSGWEEAYFTALARLVVERQAKQPELSMEWHTTIGALYFRVIEGLNGVPKMCKSIPGSSIHVGMSESEIEKHILSTKESSQKAILSAIELSSDWDRLKIQKARASFIDRETNATTWNYYKQEYVKTFIKFANLWKNSALQNSAKLHSVFYTGTL